MKNSICVLSLLALFIGFSCMAFAQQREMKEDHEKLRALKTKVEEAFNKRDAQAIVSYFTKDFAITTIDQTTLTSAAEIDGHFKKMFSSQDAIVTDMKISPEPEILTKFFDANNGYCYGKNTETYIMKNGRIVTMNSKWTAGVHKDRGEWKISILHAGVNFLNNPLLDRSKFEGNIKGVIGLAVGILFALLFCGIYICKKKS